MRQTHVRQVTNAFLADLSSQEDRRKQFALPAPRPNVRTTAFRYASPTEIAVRVFAYACVGALAVATGYAIVALIVRGLS